MSQIELLPYLFFPGNCREAMEFYKQVLGGELWIQTLGEAMGDKVPADRKDKIMHASLENDKIHFMASDGTRDKYETSFITLSLSGEDEERLRHIFDQLAQGGKTTQGLKKEVWGDTFGMVTDKFGVDWMVNISQSQSETN